MEKIMYKTTTAALALILFSSSSWAADAAAPKAADRDRAPKGPLAGLPSAEGPHIAKIRALDDNEWLNLGKPASDPQYGDTVGRSWGARMPFAPELKGAFIGG